MSYGNLFFLHLSAYSFVVLFTPLLYRVKTSTTVIFTKRKNIKINCP